MQSKYYRKPRAIPAIAGVRALSVSVVVCLTAPFAAVAQQQRDVQVLVAGNDATYGAQIDLIEAFERANPGVKVSFVGGGDFVGVDRLVSGEAAIACIRKDLRPEYARRLNPSSTANGVSWPGISRFSGVFGWVPTGETET